MTNQECVDILQQMANKEKNNETPEFRALVHAIRLCKMMECKDLADTCRDCGGCFVDWNWRNNNEQCKKCDICGKLYEYYDGIEIVKGGQKYNHIILSNSFRTKNYDLCKECMTGLIKILKKG